MDKFSHYGGTEKSSWPLKELRASLTAHAASDNCSLATDYFSVAFVVKTDPVYTVCL